ncbi:MAG: class I SAM-dependent methyltransferase [Dehalococcoidia bacterium]|nr:class I SAM-dependent methyltransferase [Dehalococcoidia bacterium]
MSVLSTGNTAKLYCLNWIERYVVEKGSEVKILDLGCGTALNFVNFLRLYPQISYVGVEPSRDSCLKAQQNLSGLNARVVNSPGYHVHEKLREKFDIVVSFSVLEHVYRRLDYLSSANACLKEDGYFLINYDAGHFIHGKEKLITAIGQAIARFGIERYYQSFVKEEDLLRMLERIRFKIIEKKFFNTSLKGTYKVIPESKRADYMKKWLRFELWLNELGIEYDDSKARFFGTRNFILAHK